MSPNNLILVAHVREGGTGNNRRSYVFPNADADLHWTEAWAARRIWGNESLHRRPPLLVRRRRAQALVLAHDLQRRMQTEYGVREVFLCHETHKTQISAPQLVA